MLMSSRAPSSRLRPFVKTLWVLETSGQAVPRERVLPTGTLHIVLRLAGPGLRLFRTPEDPDGEQVGLSVIGGARETFYVRDVSQPTVSVGAQLWPGAAAFLLGVSANTLTGRHTALEDVWGQAAVAELRDRLLQAKTAAAKLALFEQALEARLPQVKGVHPAVAHALDRFAQQEDVASVVDSLGFSHRHFITLFTGSVGLSPKRFSRVLRFSRAVEQLNAEVERSLAAVGLAAGYSDQAHFSREFQSFAGISPGQYRKLRLSTPNHVPLT